MKKPSEAEPYPVHKFDIALASASGRTWNVYAPYNPAIVGELVTVLWVYLSDYYSPTYSKDKKMSAMMRLGLAGGRIRLDDIIRFEPYDDASAQENRPLETEQPA